MKRTLTLGIYSLVGRELYQDSCGSVQVYLEPHLLETVLVQEKIRVLFLGNLIWFTAYSLKKISGWMKTKKNVPITILE